MVGKTAIKIVVAIIVVAALAAGAGYGAFQAVNSARAAVPSSVAAPILVPGNFAELAEKIRDGVVNVQTVKTISGGGRVFRQFFGNPFQMPNPFGRQNPFDDFFDRNFNEDDSPDSFQQKSLGSGFIVDRDGYIITNNHVIEKADQIKVKLANGKEFDAKVIGRDSKTDLALIKIAGSPDLRPLRLGDSDALKVGNWVVAIGSPFGLEQTVTAGIVSAKGRTIGAGPYDSFIQTDASINPGNSGGPLINTLGEVIGINTAIIASGQGIGFAIPVNMAKEVLPQLKNNGKVSRGWIGVSIQEITPDLANSFNLKQRKGALIADVIKDGPADKAGIQRGDIITEFDRKQIDSAKDLPRAVAAVPAGKSVTVKLLHNGTDVNRNITVSEMKDEKDEITKTSSGKKLGINVQNITPEMARAFSLGDTNGIVVTQVQPGSPAANADIRQGDIIKELNRKPVRDTQDLVQGIEQATNGNLLLFLKRNENSFYVSITLK
ncbi:MAG TPA: DegQ family serine endoprotease [Syntrophorhabdaceae bacterium]|nr:DegQ family serine endoprotease [Syntrophorhabdaceae bacterium]